MQNFAQKINIRLARFAIFVVYFWFGALKVFTESPANPLVSALLDKTLPGVPFEIFIIFFGIFEMVIGILFLIPKAEKLAILLFCVHFVMIIMPLLILPQTTWQGFLTPTLEGQYIIKNILLLSVVVSIWANLGLGRNTKNV